VHKTITHNRDQLCYRRRTDYVRRTCTSLVTDEPSKSRFHGRGSFVKSGVVPEKAIPSRFSVNFNQFNLVCDDCQTLSYILMQILLFAARHISAHRKNRRRVSFASYLHSNHDVIHIISRSKK